MVHQESARYSTRVPQHARTRPRPPAADSAISPLRPPACSLTDSHTPVALAVRTGHKRSGPRPTPCVSPAAVAAGIPGPTPPDRASYPPEARCTATPCPVGLRAYHSPCWSLPYYSRDNVSIQYPLEYILISIDT